jgi:N-acetylglucosamine-6-sulfatase
MAMRRGDASGVMVNSRRVWLTVTAGLALSGALVAPLPLQAPSTQAQVSRRLNVLLITADDMRPGELRAMPYTRRVLARRGVTFTDAIAPFTLCCPARTSILTGQYAHNHGVRSNTWPNGSYWAFRHRGNTLPVWLSRRGYRTALVGKYLAEYAKHKPPALHHRNLYEAQPGWTHWYGLYGRVDAYNHVDLVVKTPNSRLHRFGRDRYVTNYLTGITRDLIGSYHRARRPFFIWLSQIAPHGTADGGWNPPIPQSRDYGDFRGTPLSQSRIYRSALNENTNDKRGPMHARQALDLDRLRGLYQRRLESLKSLDRSIHRVVRKLKATREFAHTLIIFTSDNGYGLGEHRYVGKNMPYDAMLKIPMIVSAPGLKQRYRPDAGPHAHVRVRDTVTTIDIPATIIEASGAHPGRPIEGLNMLRPAANPDYRSGDRAVLIESGSRARHKTRASKFVGIRTNRWTWFAWHTRPAGTQLRLGAREFFDRHALPSQVTNIAGTSRFPRVERQLTALTERMWDCRGQACVRNWR